MKLDRELSGALVISLEQAVAAPYCGLLLANAGARVIKVEREEGDFARSYDAGAGGESAIFAWLNRGKESICLNLKDAQDQKMLRAMVKQADIFLCNLAPGALERMGLTSEVLREDNQGLIICTISGYGETGDAASKKAYDFLVQAEVGLCSVTGDKDAPSRVGISLTDLSTGLTAFSAILRAWIQRSKTGVGVDLSVSMFDVMADWMNMPLLAHRYMGGAPERTGLRHSFVAPYGAFACGDGEQVLLSVQSNREFSIFCDRVLDQPLLAEDTRFADNPQRYLNRVELDALVTEAFSAHSAQQVIALLDSAGIANARLNSVEQLSDHPFLKNTTASVGDFDLSIAALPVSGVEVDGAMQTVPALGSQSDTIREEFENR